MGAAAKRELILEGLDCANCAAQIEAQVNAIKGVTHAFMNFMERTLTIELDDMEDVQRVIGETREVVKKFEPHVVVKEKAFTRVPRKVFVLVGLDCANCAAKIEGEVRNIPGVKAASLDFVARTLSIEVSSEQELGRVAEEAAKIIKKIEPDVDLVESGQKQTALEEDKEYDKKKIARLVVGTVLFCAAYVLKFSFWPEFILYFLSYLLVGGDVLLRAAGNIGRGQVFDENFLMGVATIGAFAIKQFPEGVAVMLFYQIGELFQDIAVNRSRKSIKSLTEIRPDFANLLQEGEITKVSPEEVRIGERIIVKPGERIPLDGVVVEGRSMVDTSALTGESVPREVEEGSEVLGGFMNRNGLLIVQVTKIFGESTVAKIFDLVQNAGSRKAPTENFITKFARFYTPVVVLAALAIAIVPPLVLPGASYGIWIYRALVFLVVSCPCALVISIPLSFFGGIGGASKNGILVKGGNFLEALNNVDTVVFDKTGTLTKGVFNVTEINPQGNITKEDLLEMAAYAESYSNHPIALSIRNAYNKGIKKELIQSYDEISGKGVKTVIDGKEVLAGNARLMAQEGIAFEPVSTAGTVVHMAFNRDYAGYLVISDQVREDAFRAVRGLRQMGVTRLVMLTGDSLSVGTKVANDVGLDEVYAELLPDQKVEKLEMLTQRSGSKGKVLFVGDGINDAPVLARADVGVAMGGLGSDAAIEAADIVLMTDEPAKLVSAIKIAKRTKRIVWENIYMALGVKGVVLVLGAVGMATMWEAVFADVGVALLAVLNAMRAMMAAAPGKPV